MRMIRFFILLLACTASAQDFSASWEGLFSFNRIIDLEQTDDQVFVASENALFIYDKATRSFNTITTVDGLSGDPISQIFYRESVDQLVIGYEDGLIQILQDDVVLDVVAIRDKQVINPDRKRINEFLLNDALLYIATDFGIAIYDLDRLEFDDTYFIGAGGAQVRVRSIEIFDGFIYAATQDAGILRADVSNPFLLDFMNWTLLNLGNFNEVLSLENQIYTINNAGGLLQLTGNNFTSTGYQFPQGAVDASVFNNQLVVTGSNYLQVLDVALAVTIDVRDLEGVVYRFTAGTLSNDALFIGTRDNGMIRLERNNITTPEFIIADGPVRNRAFSLTTGPDVLWVGYGDYDLIYNPFPLERFGISRFKEGAWTNFTPAEVENVASISSITLNPENSSELFINSMHNGVLQLVDGQAATLFGINNSSLTSILPPATDFVRIPDSGYDSQGNLWVLASIVEDGLNRKTPAGQWSAVDLSQDFPTITQTSLTKLAITRSGTLVFGTVDEGVIAYNPTENRFGNLRDQIQQGNLINNYVGEVAIDQNGQLWIGSNLGLRVLFGAENIVSDNPPDARPIIIEDQIGVARELLKDEAILDIEVDGNNRKWVATASSGAFLFSPSGQETIFQFTKNNSPLPSDGVNDIAIDNTSGKVYFATDNGIVSFQGDRTSQPADNLENVFAFPNPVKPGFTGNVTIDGLTDRARIKITDIEGNLVNEIISQGGSVQWDTTSFDGNPVASGVYILLISTSDNLETTVSKIMVIR